MNARAEGYRDSTGRSRVCAPILTAACAAVGFPWAVGVLGGPGGAAGALLFGVGRASIPALGGTLLVQPPLLPLPLALGGPPGVPCTGTASTSIPIPNDPLLLGAVFQVQALVLDPGAPGGVAMSDGVELTVG